MSWCIACGCSAELLFAIVTVGNEEGGGGGGGASDPGRAAVIHTFKPMSIPEVMMHAIPEPSMGAAMGGASMGADAHVNTYTVTIENTCIQLLRTKARCRCRCRCSSTSKTCKRIEKMEYAMMR